MQNFIYILKTMYLGTYKKQIMELFIILFIFLLISTFVTVPSVNIFKRLIYATSGAAYLIITLAWYEAFKNSVFSIERNAPILILCELQVVYLMIEMVKKHRKESY